MPSGDLRLFPHDGARKFLQVILLDDFLLPDLSRQLLHLCLTQLKLPLQVLDDSSVSLITFRQAEVCLSLVMNSQRFLQQPCQFGGRRIRARPHERFVDDLNFRGGSVQSPVVFATAVDVVLLVHFLIFEDQQRRERRHHIHRLTQRDDRVFVLRRSQRDEPVDLQAGPASRQVVGILYDLLHFDCLLERLAVEQSRHDDRLRQIVFA